MIFPPQIDSKVCYIITVINFWALIQHISKQAENHLVRSPRLKLEAVAEKNKKVVVANWEASKKILCGESAKSWKAKVTRTKNITWVNQENEK